MNCYTFKYPNTLFKVILHFLIFHNFSCRKRFQKEILVSQVDTCYDLSIRRNPKADSKLINIKIIENNCYDTIYFDGGVVAPYALFTLNNNSSIMNSGSLCIRNPKKISCKLMIEYFWYDPFAL